MTTKTLTARILLALGFALFAGGLVLGFIPKTADGISCGSAFKASTDAAVADYGSTLTGSYTDPPLSGSYARDCADTRTAAKAPAVTLLVIGGALIAAGAVTALPSTGTRRRNGQATTSSRRATTDSTSSA